MSEFNEVMKQIKRICKANDYRCTDCPMSTQSFCQMPAFDMEGFESIENIVMTWAAEHQEPVYPTWGEWLINVGAARKIPTDIPFELSDGRIIDSPWETVVDVNTSIPADIAQKLGIEPKEVKA